MKPYSKEIIEQFTAYVKGGGDAYLINNGLSEFIDVLDAIRGSDKAMASLMKAKQYELAGFVDAVVNNNGSALRMLIAKKRAEWAAVASIINGDKKAPGFLTSLGKPYFIDLAYAIMEVILNDTGIRRSSFPF